jgi:hypothetical protein
MYKSKSGDALKDMLLQGLKPVVAASIDEEMKKVWLLLFTCSEKPLRSLLTRRYRRSCRCLLARLAAWPLPASAVTPSFSRRILTPPLTRDVVALFAEGKGNGSAGGDKQSLLDDIIPRFVALCAGYSGAC